MKIGNIGKDITNNEKILSTYDKQLFFLFPVKYITYGKLWEMDQLFKRNY